jgi:hypothetical protein
MGLNPALFKYGSVVKPSEVFVDLTNIYRITVLKNLGVRQEFFM